jgi:hypothetical protein
MENVSSRKNVAAPRAVMPKLVPVTESKADNKIRNGFIRHPQQFPLEAKRLRSWGRSTRMETSTGDIGLSFVSRKYIPTGSEMELSIPLRGDVQKFHGHVVLVREIVGGYEIGVWLASADEASRARLVEQICELECSLRSKAGATAASSRPAATRTPATRDFPEPLAN